MAERGGTSRHPWHPAAVHFPIACWTLAAGVDLLILAGAAPQLPGIEPSALSSLMLWSGNVLALPAAIAGLVDYAALPRAVQEGVAIQRHMAWMGSAWAVFLLAGVARTQAGPLSAAAPWWLVLTEVAATVCLVAGGSAAATVVFEQLGTKRSSAAEPAPIVGSSQRLPGAAAGRTSGGRRHSG